MMLQGKSTCLHYAHNNIFLAPAVLGCSFSISFSVLHFRLRNSSLLLANTLSTMEYIRAVIHHATLVYVAKYHYTPLVVHFYCQFCECEKFSIFFNLSILLSYFFEVK